MPDAHSNWGDRNASAATTTASAATADCCAVRRSSTTTPVARRPSCSTRRTSVRSRSSKRDATSLSESRSGPSTVSAPAQRIEPSGCGSPATGRVLTPYPSGSSAPNSRSSNVRIAAPTGESENAALCACSSPSAVEMRSSHSSPATKSSFSLNAGRGIAQVQCAP
ncbi:hypothetical protein SRABI128_00624 [Microbacterium sp. Bi128]|nr:hypothetical protein SRABI128_00624 [Microbacterium sp. Bi128]